MRILLAALCLAAAPAARAAPLLDGPVVGGAFGMGGSDYYGDVRDKSPFGTEPDAVPAPRRRLARTARAPRGHGTRGHGTQGHGTAGGVRQ